MQSKIVWSEQVKNYIEAKAPEPRRALWREIKKLAEWNGRENPPKIRHLEDALSGYSRLRCGRDRIIFFETVEAGQRVIQCIHAAPRNSIYETFRELFLDEVTA